MDARRNQTHNKGLTLIEVLVALVLVAVAVSMFTYFIDALRLTGVSRDETRVAAYMRNYLDTLRADWRDFDGYVYRVDSADPGDAPEGLDVKVNISSEAGSLVGYPGGGSVAQDLSALRTVTISVTDARDLTRSLTTQIARPALNRESP